MEEGFRVGESRPIIAAGIKCAMNKMEDQDRQIKELTREKSVLMGHPYQKSGDGVDFWKKMTKLFSPVQFLLIILVLVIITIQIVDNLIY